MKFTSDVDIDFANRQHVLDVIKHVGASIIKDGNIKIAHNTGVYVTSIPCDPVTNRATIDYHAAEDRGYIKLDFLNVGLYTQIKDEDHLIYLMKREPPWHRLYDPEFCSQLMHVGNHYDLLIRMPEAVNTIARLAMFLAIIRPAKRHLLGLPWAEVAKTVWAKDENGGYGFKMSHSISYGTLVTVHMNLLDDV